MTGCSGTSLSRWTIECIIQHEGHKIKLYALIKNNTILKVTLASILECLLLRYVFLHHSPRSTLVDIRHHQHENLSFCIILISNNCILRILTPSACLEIHRKRHNWTAAPVDLIHVSVHEQLNSRKLDKLFEFHQAVLINSDQDITNNEHLKQTYKSMTMPTVITFSNT